MNFFVRATNLRYKVKKLNKISILVIFIFNTMYAMKSHKKATEYYAITSFNITDIGKSYDKLPKSWACRRDILMQMPEKVFTLHLVHLCLPQKIQNHIFEYMAQSMCGDDTQNFYKKPIITICELYHDLDKRVHHNHKSIIPILSSMQSDKREIVLRALNDRCPLFTTEEKKILDEIMYQKNILKPYITGKEAFLFFENHIIFKKYITFLFVMYGFHVTCKMMFLGLFGCVGGFDFMFTPVAVDVASELSYKYCIPPALLMLVMYHEMTNLDKKYQKVTL